MRLNVLCLLSVIIQMPSDIRNNGDQKKWRIPNTMIPRDIGIKPPIIVIFIIREVYHKIIEQLRVSRTI